MTVDTAFMKLTSMWLCTDPDDEYLNFSLYTQCIDSVGPVFAHLLIDLCIFTAAVCQQARYIHAYSSCRRENNMCLCCACRLSVPAAAAPPNNHHDDLPKAASQPQLYRQSIQPRCSFSEQLCLLLDRNNVRTWICSGTCLCVCANIKWGHWLVRSRPSFAVFVPRARVNWVKHKEMRPCVCACGAYHVKSAVT